MKKPLMDNHQGFFLNDLYLLINKSQVGELIQYVPILQ
jgi:hypothetical protein